MREVGGPLLDRLALASEKLALGERPGSVSTALTGQGQTLAGHRPYALGDDPRRIDHRAWARLDRPVVRTYRRDREQRLHLILDTSGSMGAAFPERYDRAREIATALAAIGLAGLEDVRLSALADPPRTLVTVAHGRSSSAMLAARLRGLACGGRAPAAALASLLRGAPRGVSVVLTDFLDDAPAGGWVAALAGPSPGWVIVLTHPDDPLVATGEAVELLDAEGRGRRQTVLDPPTVAAARARLLHHRTRRTAALRAAGVRVVDVDAAQSWEAALMGPLRAAGLVVTS
jgi:uncharacterized protein (DUF58 family)